MSDYEYTESVLPEKMPILDRIEDRITSFFASRFYILGLLLFTVLWMSINASWFIYWHDWDPYPFILLNLVFSTIAAFQQPMIMLVQKRVERQMRAKAEADARETHAYRQRMTRMMQGAVATAEVLTDVSRKTDLMLDSVKLLLRQEAGDHDEAGRLR